MWKNIRPVQPGETGISFTRWDGEKFSPHTGERMSYEEYLVAMDQEKKGDGIISLTTDRGGFAIGTNAGAGWFEITVPDSWAVIQESAPFSHRGAKVLEKKFLVPDGEHVLSVHRSRCTSQTGSIEETVEYRVLVRNGRRIYTPEEYDNSGYQSYR